MHTTATNVEIFIDGFPLVINQEKLRYWTKCIYYRPTSHFIAFAPTK